MEKNQIKIAKRERRHRRIRSKVSGTAAMPRLSVFKSNKGLYAQIIDDEKKHTLAASSSVGVKGKAMKDKAIIVGQEIAKKAITLGVKEVVFDRGGYLYTGNIKALADGAREGGLKF